MKKTTFIKITRWVAAILLLACGVFMFYQATTPLYNGVNYTEEYIVYEDIKAMSTVDEAKAYLGEKKLEYKIQENVLSVDKFDHVECKIINENLQLVKNDHMEHFEELDTHNTSTITTKGVLQGDKIVERYTLFDWHDYVKINANYYIRPTLILFVLAIAFSAGAGFCAPFTFTRKKKNKTQPISIEE